MDAATLRQIMKEEMALVQQAFAGEMLSMKCAMDKQTSDLTANYRADLHQVRLEQQALREMVNLKFDAVHNMMRQLNAEGSRPSTATSQQTYISNINEPQQLPDESGDINVAAWNATAGAPSWAPGADDSAAPAACYTQAYNGTPQGQSVPQRSKKTCVLCNGGFKHRRGARQHMMKAFKPNAMCKFIPGYAPHEDLLEPFLPAVNPETTVHGDEWKHAAWKLAVKTLMRRSA